jgi:5-methyltetrahydropteroyltriglutamate--homocysteine methyltransferase
MNWKAHEPGAPALEFAYPLTVTGRLLRRRFATPEEFAYARGRARRPVKVTLPGPLCVINAYVPENSGEAYPDPFELFGEVADLVKQEAEELARLGCEYIQLDCPEWTMLCDPDQPALLGGRGISLDRLIDEGVELCNRIATVPGPRFGMHLCRGSLPTHFYSTGGYDAIVEAVLARATNFDVFMLEYDDVRSGSFEPLAKIPTDKTITLGLVSTKRAEVESVEEITARIIEATKYYSLENLAVSSQCGFGSGFTFEAPAER